MYYHSIKNIVELYKENYNFVIPLMNEIASF